MQRLKQLGENVLYGVEIEVFGSLSLLMNLYTDHFLIDDVELGIIYRKI
jgi:hypothetical protein